MDCEQIQESFVAVLAGETIKERLEVERHLMECQTCSEIAERDAAIWRLLDEEHDFALPEPAKHKIRLALARPDRTGYKKPGFLRKQFWFSLAAMLLVSTLPAYLFFTQPIQQTEFIQIQKQPETLGQEKSSASEFVQEQSLQSQFVAVLLAPEARDSLRIQAVSALKPKGKMDEVVQSALIQALLSDPSPSVRLKAADVLGGAVEQPAVQQAFLQVLASDPNPGLRIRAIDAISEAPKHGLDSKAIDILSEAATEDSADRYIQIRAAEFLSNLRRI